MKKICIKLTAFVLYLVMLLPMLTSIPFTAFASGGSDAESIYSEGTSSETIYLDGVYYSIDKKTSYIGYGAYQLNVQIKTSLSSTETPLHRSSAHNGYFTVEKSGYYLLELWGGSGSDGGDITYPLVDSYGGTGGAGGYLYAKVYLEVGQTLAYSIGTNGDRTIRSDYGGGENDGGEKGEEGSYEVGGGGGYSALYYFEPGEFDPSWLSEDGEWNLPASVNLSRYVMIAAGGGGGGAGNGWLYASSSRRANGGAGGNVNNGISMVLQGENYAVEGYIFAGRNGSSSTSVTTYVGRGGSNVPGVSPSTSDGDYSATPNPNDWSGSYNLFQPIGAGGGGNFRGGGGGAGYCGGSGGIMQSRLTANSVGGGGGGSSFLATSIGGSATTFGNDIDDYTKTLLVGEDNCPSDVGGAFACTYIGEVDSSTLDTSYLNSVTVKGQISQYFNVYSASAVNYIETPNGTLTMQEDGNFILENANISTGNATADGNLLSMQFAMKPKDDFCGGNNVPLLLSLEATVIKGGEEEVIISEENPDTDYVNVPLDFYISTNSVMKSLKKDETSITYNSKDLYNPTYADAITQFASGNGASAGWQYNFIENLSDYKIYEGKQVNEANLIAYNTTLTISDTTYYAIALTATPKQNGYAKVGPQITSAETFVGIALVGIVRSDIFKEGWEYDVTADKTLSYDGENYSFVTTVDQSITSNYDDTTTFQYGDSAAYPITNSGYYLIQAWGARGGDGGDAYARNSRDYASGGGGKGGDGGYNSGFVWLEAGDMLEWTFGQRGNDGGDRTTTTANATDVEAEATGGYGGAYSVVWLVRGDTRTAIMVAGGGGGGGGGGAGVTDLGTDGGYPGYSASQINTVTYGTNAGTLTSATSNTNYAGGRGGTGSISFSSILGLLSGSRASAGLGGTNFAHSDYVNKGKTDGETVYMSRLVETLLGGEAELYTKPSTDNSAARISYICTPQTEEELNELPGIQTSGTFSRYFEIVTTEDGIPMIELEINGMEAGNIVRGEVDDSGYTTVTYYDKDDTDLVLAKFSYKIVEDGESGTTFYDIKNNLYYPTFEISPTSDVEGGYIAHSGFSLVLTLKPKEGFLGGNDVPLLQDSGDPDLSCISISQEGGTPYYLSKNDYVDYANVAIQYDLAADFSVKDGEILLGDSDTSNDTVTTDELYELTTNFSETEDWKKEFVEIALPENEVIDASTDMPYDITVWLRPKAAPEKATVIGATEGLSVTLPAVVYVKYYVTYNMNHMTYTGEPAALRNTQFETVLLAETGYAQPKLEENGKRYITVKINGIEMTEFTYDATTGALSIPAEYITGPIEISAEAKGKQYKIHYVYSLDGVTNIEHEETYISDETIDYTWFNAQVFPEKIGYEMVWEWDTADTLQPTLMPAHDVWVIGSYEKSRYNLTVNYLDSQGSPLCEPHTELVPFEEDFRVVAPNIDGYIASSLSATDYATDVAASVQNDPFVIKGTMGSGDVTVNVTYLSASNRLIILYLSPNDRELATRVDITLTENATYSYVSPAVEGYTADPALATVSGQMIGTESKFIKVYYTPNTYSVDFEYRYEDMEYLGPREEGIDLPYVFTSATMSGLSNITVEYDNVYGYNVALDSYGMPSPLVLGYTFDGWYTDTTYTTEVTEADIVKITADTTLYAKWTPTKYILTIKYDFAFDPGDFEPDYQNLGNYENLTYYADGNYYYIQIEYCEGQQYEFNIGDIVGYSPYTNFGLSNAALVGDKISGTMPASHKMIYITYGINSYTIRFLDVPGENITYPEDEDPGEDLPSFNTVWQTLIIKHGVRPEYTISLPEHVYDPANPETFHEYYTYTFTNWLKAGTLTTYSPTTTQFDVAVADQDYYATYTATENVAYVVQNSAIVGYYDSVQKAVDVAAGYLSSSTSAAPTVKLRRNGTADTVDLRVTDGSSTVVAGDNKAYYMGFDLNGYRLISDNAVLCNNMYLYLFDSVGTGEIFVSGTGDVTAVKAGSYALRIGQNLSSNDSPVSIKAISENGNATGISGDTASIYLYAGSDVYAHSESKTAYGIYFYKPKTTGSACYTYVYGNISAVSDKSISYGISSNFTIRLYEGASVSAQVLSGFGNSYGLYLSGNSSAAIELYSAGVNVEAQSDKGIAYGVNSSAAFYSTHNTTTQSNISATSANGDAYGVYATRLSNALAANITATAENGKATALKANGSAAQNLGASGTPYTIRAVGKNAIAADYIYNVYVYASLIAEGSESAVGITTTGTISNSYTVTVCDGASIQAVTESGNAYAFYNTRGSFSNTLSPCSVTAEATSGNAYLAYNTILNSYSTDVTLSATATTGNAYGFASTNSGVLTASLSQNVSITASATDGGKAYGAHIGRSTTLAGTLSANGASAYGVYVAADGTASITATANIGATSNTAAYGLYIANRGIAEAAAGSVINATATDSGSAYGIYNSGTVRSFGALVTSSASAVAYGFANSSGAIESVLSSLTVTAESANDDSYAFYNSVSNLGTGTLAGSLNKGIFTAIAAEGKTGYAIYAADDTVVYISGSELHYKGNSDTSHRNAGVLIVKGYAESLCDTHAEYVGYYHLTAQTYIMVFQLTDPTSPGTVIAEYERTYTPDDTALAAGTPYINSSAYTGYTSAWPAFTFDAPEGSADRKYVVSVHTLNSYTVYYYSDKNTTAIHTVVYKYQDTITPPLESEFGVTKYGYTFGNAWTDTNGNTYTFTTMPASDLHLYAVWIPGTFTITFVTNGGTEIAPITGTYGTYISVQTPTKPGYTFDAWYLSEDLSGSTYYPSSIPGEDIVLYAKWTESVILAILGNPIGVTVRLDINLDGVCDENDMFDSETPASFVMTANEFTMYDIVMPWWITALKEGELMPDGNYLLLGWSDKPNGVGGKMVNLGGGVDSWGITPVNGYIDLYPIVTKIDYAQDLYDMLIDFDYNILNGKPFQLGEFTADFISVNTSGSSTVGVMQANQYTADNALVFSYRALFEGEQTVYFLPAQIKRIMHASVKLYSNGSEVSLGESNSISIPIDLSLNDWTELPCIKVNMKVGDVLTISIYDDAPTGDGDTGNSSIICLIDSPAKLENEADMINIYSSALMHNAKNFMVYSSDMGNVSLPLHPTTGYEQVTGWRFIENGSYSEPITSLNASIFTHGDIWTSIPDIPYSIVVLLPYTEGQVDVGTWLGTITSGRHFNMEVLSGDIVLNTYAAPNGSLTFVFLMETAGTTPALTSLKFTNGLPAGTTLSLMVQYGSTDYADFYYYIVETNGTKVIPLNLFKRAGSTDETFSGFSTIMIFNISYASTSSAQTSESVTLSVDGADIGVSLGYQFVEPTVIETADDPENLTIPPMTSDETLYGVLPIPSLKDKGFSPYDRVMIFMYMEDKNGNTVSFPANILMSASVKFTVSGVTQTIDASSLYITDDFLIADWNVTVGEIQDLNLTLYGTMVLETLMYHGFDGVLVYDIAVVPQGADLANGNFISSEAYLHAEYRIDLQIIDAPGFTASESSSSVAQGELKYIDLLIGGKTGIDFDLYVYQLDETGQLTTNDSCANIIEGVITDDTGKAAGTFTSDESLPFYVKEDAPLGTYFLVAYHGEQYFVYVLTVTAPDTQ